MLQACKPPSEQCLPKRWKDLQDAFFNIKSEFSSAIFSPLPRSRQSSLETLLPEPNLPELQEFNESAPEVQSSLKFMISIVKTCIDINILKEDTGNDWDNHRTFISTNIQQAIGPNEFIQMEPRRHVDCGHCLDMERGHSSLVPLVRVAFRARLSCPGHLVTAFHGFTMLYMNKYTYYKPVILARPIHEKKQKKIHFPNVTRIA